MIFMTHPQHGAMNVYSSAESLAHQKNGWVESTPEKWLGDKFNPEDESPAGGKPAKNKPGRKPKAE